MKYLVGTVVALLVAAVAVPFCILAVLAFKQGLPPVATPLAVARWRIEGEDLVRIDEDNWLSVTAANGPAETVIARLALQRGWVVERQLGPAFVLAPKGCAAPCPDGKKKTAHMQKYLRGFDVLSLD